MCGKKMLLSIMTRKFLSIFVLGICNIVIVNTVNPATTIIGGITNVATSATNFRKFSYNTFLDFLSRWFYNYTANYMPQVNVFIHIYIYSENISPMKGKSTFT